MRMAKKIIISLIVLSFSSSNVFAFSSFSTSTQKFDSTLSDQSLTTYSQPTKIYITNITTSSQLPTDPALWVKSLYYYFITRLQFPDIPYTYILDENGMIYQGTTGYIGATPSIQDLKGAVLIGYISNNPILTTRAESSLKELVDGIAYDWGISKIQTVKTNIVKEEGKLSTVTIENVFGEFTNSINTTLKDWKGYAQENLKYQVKLDSVEYSKESEIGNRVKVKLKITNANDFVWFTDKDPIYISVKGEKESTLAINKVWVSFSKPLVITDKQIKPGESLDLEFEVEPKIIVGNAEETFVIQKHPNQPFDGSEFQVKFAVTKGNNTLVEAYSNLGFVNVRECRWSSCKIIDSVKNGSVFVLLGEEEGWYKIKYSEGVEAWAVKRYFKKI